MWYSSLTSLMAMVTDNGKLKMQTTWAGSLDSWVTHHACATIPSQLLLMWAYREPLRTSWHKRKMPEADLQIVKLSMCTPSPKSRWATASFKGSPERQWVRWGESPLNGQSFRLRIHFMWKDKWPEMEYKRTFQQWWMAHWSVSWQHKDSNNGDKEVWSRGR